MTLIEWLWVTERLLGAVILVMFLAGLAIYQVRAELRRRRAFRARLDRLDQVVEQNRHRFSAMGFDVKRDGTRLVLEKKERP